uniref:E3 ubiquitin-protein ligase rnf213-alpha-like n=1 Tax=Styela clava TaxID=7725 RepID=UPI001939A76F|nr:E3 ubiquitin-protein ligase rnf213-alpha-like [Styela clava]XP_039248261.1 E3 ubiquitin-protein ligase rnf213-alpha-like [Styela clava]
MNDADSITLHQFFESMNNNSLIRFHIESYFKAWKLVNASTLLTWNSPISVAIPAKRGNGKFAKLLCRRLLDIHNDFLTKCNQAVSELSCDEISVSDVKDSHMIQVDRENDLNELISMHVKYDIKYDAGCGAIHVIKYNVNALERLIQEKHVKHKKRISVETIPCIQYPQDVGISEDMSELKTRIKQKLLSTKDETSIDANVSASTPAHLCDGVRTLSHAISFLSKTSSQAENSLRDYMTNTLLVDSESVSVIPKSIQIEQTLALYQRLTWHKSVMFAQRGLNPYVVEEGQQKIPDNLVRRLERYFSEIKAEELQQRLNEILITKPFNFHSDWSLLDIFPDFDFLDEDIQKNARWYDKMPEEICYCHIIDLFKRTCLIPKIITKM